MPLNLHDFERITFLTGAGLSAESGLATYRGPGGIWGEYRYEEYACQAAFERDPEKVWDFHDLRRGRCAACQPNRGHAIIAAIQRARPGTRLVTQNIDGFHTQAGSPAVIELHGCMWRIRCDREGKIVANRQVPLTPRRCSCGAYWRPDIVWFGDMLRQADLEAAFEAAENCDLFVCVGTSGAVQPAASLPLAAKQSGAKLAEINIEDTPLTAACDYVLRGTASDMLARLWEG